MMATAVVVGEVEGRETRINSQGRQRWVDDLDKSKSIGAPFFFQATHGIAVKGNSNQPITATHTRKSVRMAVQALEMNDSIVPSPPPPLEIENTRYQQPNGAVGAVAGDAQRMRSVITQTMV